MFIPSGSLQNAQIKQGDQFPCPLEVRYQKGKFKYGVHKVRKSLDALSASDVQKDRGAKH